MAANLRTLDDATIDSIVDETGWLDNNITEGYKENQDNLREIIQKLEADYEYSQPGSLNREKIIRALRTYNRIRDEFNADFNAYFKFALKKEGMG